MTRIVLGAWAAWFAIILASELIGQEPQRQIEAPMNFRATMAHYATVDRADGKVYELFIDQVGLASWLESRQLAPGSTFVIESFDALRDGSGELQRDEAGRLVIGSSDNEIHVSQKQVSWSGADDCVSPSLMNGQPLGEEQWRMAAFDPRAGERILAASHSAGECHQCHTERRAEDFILSRGLLDRYARSREAAHIAFDCEGRDICFGGDRELTNSPPDCPSTFSEGGEE